jgi:AraC-like DNA-binding protein
MARRLFWHLYSLAEVRLTAPEHHEPFEKPGAHLFWTTSGHGVLELQTGNFALEPGARVWFVDMKKPRTYVPEAGRHLGICGIRFGGPALESWHEVLGGNREPEFAFRDQAFLRRSYREILHLHRRKPAEWEWQIHDRLHRLMSRLLAARGLLGSRGEELPEPIVRVINAVGADPTRYWRARDLPGIAHISYSKLRALFFQTQGETLHRYLERFRLDQAKRLLADERLSVKEVADRLHFPNEFYFSRFFHRCTGMSPTQFRSSLKSRKPSDHKSS